MEALRIGDWGLCGVKASVGGYTSSRSIRGDLRMESNVRGGEDKLDGRRLRPPWRSRF